MVILRNILAVLIGWFVGSILNMTSIELGMKLIPPPSGFDYSNMDGLAAAIQHFEFKHFASPLFAHAFGTLIGATLTGIIAGTRKMQLALVIGAVFFAGGAYMVYLLPSPLWFNILDLGLAYFPMAFLGGKIALLLKRKA